MGPTCSRTICCDFLSEDSAIGSHGSTLGGEATGVRASPASPTWHRTSGSFSPTKWEMFKTPALQSQMSAAFSSLGSLSKMDDTSAPPWHKRDLQTNAFLSQPPSCHFPHVAIPLNAPIHIQETRRRQFSRQCDLGAAVNPIPPSKSQEGLTWQWMEHPQALRLGPPFSMEALPACPAYTSHPVAGRMSSAVHKCNAHGCVIV